MYTCSGGTIYTVTGQNLDVVEEPHLLLYVRGVASQQKRQAEEMEQVEYVLQADHVSQSPVNLQ